MGWNATNSNTDLTEDVWMTLAITNTTSNTHIMYLNGVADGTGSFSGGSSNPISGMAIMDNEISPTQNDKIIVDSVVYKNSTVTASEIAGWDSKIRGLNYTYPNLSKGTLFEESDTGKIYMWDGTSSWNEMT